jgi:glutamate-5-semialdehyde dehydrogenase
VDQKLDVAKYVQDLGIAARAAARELARADTAAKNRALEAMAAEIRAQSKAILAANEEDLRNTKGRDAAFLDRLRLTPKLVEQMAAGVEAVVALEDPVGKISDRVRRPTGIEVARMRVPLGVVGIIYESRPNVTADAAALCIKSGNASILRWLRSLASNRAIAACVRRPQGRGPARDRGAARRHRRSRRGRHR